MQTIKIPQNVASQIQQYATNNYDKYFARMFGTRKERIRSLFYGKMGEQAVAQYLSVSVDFSLGTDRGFDLLYFSNKLGIKTKAATKLPYSFNGWFCHIPCDQYSKVTESCDYLIACIFLFNHNSVYIIGFLPIKTVTQIAVLHRAGERINKYFVLPPPDSYGIDFSLFQDIENLKCKEGGITK